MQPNFNRYRAIGQRFVTGFLEPEILLVLDVLNAAQRAKQVSGAVAEIGVHHGKLWSSMADVLVHQGDSTKLAPAKLRELAGGDIRLFSVDGGHTDEIVYSDTKLAEATLADGGIVIADDVFNDYWPGVATGTLRYLNDGAKLAPFLIGFNKVFFTQPEHSELYRNEVESALSGKLRLATATSEFAGHEVALVAPQGAKDILRKSELARTVYHSTYRGMVRGLQVVSGGRGKVTGE
jgi:hypothetical protein